MNENGNTMKRQARHCKENLLGQCNAMNEHAKMMKKRQKKKCMKKHLG